MFHYRLSCIACVSLTSIASLLPITGPVFEVLLSRLLPAEARILPGPQGRIIPFNALDVVTDPSRYLRDVWTFGVLGMLALNLRRGLPATSLNH